jgi:hypothetical protein
MTLHLVKPEVERITNLELWREIVELLIDRAAPKDRREAIVKMLDAHFIVYGRGKGESDERT